MKITIFPYLLFTFFFRFTDVGCSHSSEGTIIPPWVNIIEHTPLMLGSWIQKKMTAKKTKTHFQNCTVGKISTKKDLNYLLKQSELC